MINISALRKCYRIAGWGSKWRDKVILLCISLLTMMDPNRRPYIRNFLRGVIDQKSKGGLVGISIGLVSNSVPRKFPFVLRKHNKYDYQSLVECLGDMYPIPSKNIKYIIDGGANIGAFSISGIGRLEEVEEVIMVEPEPQNISLLKKNTNELENTTIIPTAISNEEGTANFEIRNANDGRIKENTDANNVIEVKCTKIDNLIKSEWDMKNVWVKLDIEGEEYKVIDDLLLSEYRPALISAELHDYFGRGGEEVVEDLVNAGYQVNVEGAGESGYVCRQITAELQ